MVLGVIFLAWRRPGYRGIRLRLRSGLVPRGPQIGTKAVIVKAPPSMNLSRPRVNSKSLNVHFMYNGHSFDAYEVLGLPAGCGWQQVDESYQELLKKQGGQSKEFLDLALKSLREHLRAG